jgi:hypothetical protein
MPRSPRAGKSRDLVFTQADADEFSAELGKAFPDIRFTSFAPWNWVGDDLHAPAPYFSSLGVPEESDFVAWREPTGWEPVWLPRPRLGGIYIANTPDVQFTFHRSWPRKYVEKFTGTTMESLTSQVIYSYYFRSNLEHLQFLNKVWRIIGRMSTNVLDLDSPITGERAKCVRANFWVGPDALKWAA